MMMMMMIVLCSHDEDDLREEKKVVSFFCALEGGVFCFLEDVGTEGRRAFFVVVFTGTSSYEKGGASKIRLGVYSSKRGSSLE